MEPASRFSERNLPVQTLRELKARLSLRAPQAESCARDADKNQSATR